MRRRAAYKEDMNSAQTKAGGGLGSHGLDGHTVTDERFKDKIPAYSKGFKNQEVGAPLPVPTSEEEYLKVLKEHFGFDQFYQGQFEAA